VPRKHVSLLHTWLLLNSAPSRGYRFNEYLGSYSRTSFSPTTWHSKLCLGSKWQGVTVPLGPFETLHSRQRHHVQCVSVMQTPGGCLCTTYKPCIDHKIILVANVTNRAILRNANIGAKCFDLIEQWRLRQVSDIACLVSGAAFDVALDELAQLHQLLAPIRCQIVLPDFDRHYAVQQVNHQRLDLLKQNRSLQHHTGSFTSNAFQVLNVTPVVVVHSSPKHRHTSSVLVRMLSCCRAQHD
jgi:hypothetical protein